jgi:hypothetical protein
MLDVRERRRLEALAKEKLKPKLTPEQYEARFAAEKARQLGRYCEAFRLWLSCRFGTCHRQRRCSDDRRACLKRALDRVPREVQWQTRQDILKATPANIGAPERAARQLMPRDFYV